jgi:hypothetical protein
MQVADDIAPVGVEDVAIGHEIQSVIALPVVEAYFPAAHLEQLILDVPVAVV